MPPHPSRTPPRDRDAEQTKRFRQRPCKRVRTMAGGGGEGEEKRGDRQIQTETRTGLETQGYKVSGCYFPRGPAVGGAEGGGRPSQEAPETGCVHPGAGLGAAGGELLGLSPEGGCWGAGLRGWGWGWEWDWAPEMPGMQHTDPPPPQTCRAGVLGPRGWAGREGAGLLQPGRGRGWGPAARILQGGGNRGPGPCTPRGGRLPGGP